MSIFISRQHSRVHTTKRKTTNQFITEAKLIHGENRYGYDRVVYVTNITKITITCITHGDFQQTPSNHLKGSGCPHCAGNTIKSTDQFITEAQSIHGKTKYGYTKTVYVGAHKKITILCHICNTEFQQTPDSHLSGKGCPYCAGHIIKTSMKFVTDAKVVHGERYGYDKISYVKAKWKITITCPSHGDFQQTPDNHLNGQGCPHCAGNTIKSTDQFITEAQSIHGTKYGYTKTVYVRANENITITCPSHGDFQQTPGSHLRGHGCPKCSYKVSKPETLWLDSLSVPTKYRNKSILLSNGKKTNVDGYDPMTNTVYEFHGDFWHGNPAVFQQDRINKVTKKTFGELYQKTITKESLILESGYILVTMWEHDFRNKIQ